MKRSFCGFVVLTFLIMCITPLQSASAAINNPYIDGVDDVASMNSGDYSQAQGNVQNLIDTLNNLNVNNAGGAHIVKRYRSGVLVRCDFYDSSNKRWAKMDFQQTGSYKGALNLLTLYNESTGKVLAVHKFHTSKKALYRTYYYTYNSSNNLSKVYRLDFDVNMRKSVITRYNVDNAKGLRTIKCYDKNGYILNQREFNPSNLIIAARYEWDPSSHKRTLKAFYDGQGRLSSEVRDKYTRYTGVDGRLAAIITSSHRVVTTNNYVGSHYEQTTRVYDMASNTLLVDSAFNTLHMRTTAKIYERSGRQMFLEIRDYASGKTTIYTYPKTTQSHAVLGAYDTVITEFNHAYNKYNTVFKYYKNGKLIGSERCASTKSSGYKRIGSYCYDASGRYVSGSFRLDSRWPNGFIRLEDGSLVPIIGMYSYAGNTYYDLF